MTSISMLHRITYPQWAAMTSSVSFGRLRNRPQARLFSRLKNVLSFSTLIQITVGRRVEDLLYPCRGGLTRSPLVNPGLKRFAGSSHWNARFIARTSFAKSMLLCRNISRSDTQRLYPSRTLTRTLPQYSTYLCMSSIRIRAPLPRSGQFLTRRLSRLLVFHSTTRCLLALLFTPH